MTVAYEECKGSPREYFGVEGCTAERDFFVAWEDRIQFIRDMLGFSIGMTLRVPDKYDPGDGETIGGLWARDARVEAVPSPSSVDGVPWAKAKVTIIYKTSDASTFGDDGTIQPPGSEVTYVTESLQAGAEYVTIARTGLYFGTSSPVSLEDYDIEIPMKLMPLLEWQYTVHRYPVIPWELMLELPGKINDAPVASRSLGMVFPAGTLLAGPIEMSREYTSLGVTFPTITWHFIYKNNGTLETPYGWEYFLRTDSGTPTWARITDGSSNVSIYSTYDFSNVVI